MRLKLSGQRIKADGEQNAVLLHKLLAITLVVRMLVVVVVVAAAAAAAAVCVCVCVCSRRVWF
jgi:hypothetical protein